MRKPINKVFIAILSFVLVGAVGLAVFLIPTLTSPQKQHDPYSQNFSSLETAANFSLGGEESYFDKFKLGEESVLLFWGSWCPHCETLIGEVDQMNENEIIKQNLFTVAEDTALDDVKSYQDEFPIYLDQDESVYNSFKIEHIPTVFILTDQGEIVASAEGEENSFELLKEYAEYHK